MGDRSYEIVTPPDGATVTKIQNYPATSNRIANVTTYGTVTRSFTHDAAGNIVGDVKGGDTFTLRCRSGPPICSICAGLGH